MRPRPRCTQNALLGADDARRTVYIRPAGWIANSNDDRSSKVSVRAACVQCLRCGVAVALGFSELKIRLRSMGLRERGSVDIYLVFSMRTYILHDIDYTIILYRLCNIQDSNNWVKDFA